MRVTGPSQDQLDLQCSPRFYTKWECQQWPGWKGWATEKVQLPAAHFLPSRRSLKAQDPQPSPRECAEDYSVSTPVLLSLLARFSTTLKSSHCQANALGLIKGMLDPVFLPHQCVWPVNAHNLLANDPMEKPLQGSTMVSVSQGNAVLDPLLTKFPCLQAIAKKSPESSTSPLGCCVFTLPQLLVALVKEGSRTALRLLHALVLWVALKVELHTIHQGPTRTASPSRWSEG